ncbi:MAG: hypothetical protein CVV21_02830 [Candidatus Goldiibacteriota bacterium HGW-Goldbacteria-1]|jgi:hypothetical protein|nr:MAG: hypothetical protein CVV21_02830 [Candidatus Goldiibacteriota bacterium HGW-Goldbacteria-1]
MKKTVKTVQKKTVYKAACADCGALIPEEQVCVKDGKHYCVSCAVNEKQPSLYAPKGFLKVIVYILCLNPVIGFLIGTLYHSQPDKTNKAFAKVCYIIMAIGLVFCLFFLFLMAAAGSFMSGAEGGAYIQEGYY